MGERHVEELFSAAYDDVLSDTERRRFDTHLAACEQCAAAHADFRRAVDAVRALPDARMPVRVVLPSAPPVAAPSGLLERLRLPLPHLGPAWGAATFAALGIAIAVVAAHGHGGNGGGTTSSADSANALRQTTGLAGGAGARPGTRCPLPLLQTSATPGVTSGGNPAGFANRVSIRRPQRPGQELVLATTSNHYAPGAQVLVFAALTSSASSHGSAAVVPCVTLEPQQVVELIPDQFGAMDQSAGGAAAGSAAGSNGATGSSPSNASGSGPSATLAPAAAQKGVGATAPPLAALAPNVFYGPTHAGLTPQDIASFAPFILERPLAIAQPTGQTVGGNLPVQVVTIPADTPRGTVLRLVALVPSGAPNAADQPAIEAVITIDVQ